MALTSPEVPWERRFELGVRNGAVHWELLRRSALDDLSDDRCRRASTRRIGRSNYRPKVSLPIKAEAFDASFAVAREAERDAARSGRVRADRDRVVLWMAVTTVPAGMPVPVTSAPTLRPVTLDIAVTIFEALTVVPVAPTSKVSVKPIAVPVLSRAAANAVVPLSGDSCNATTYDAPVGDPVGIPIDTRSAASVIPIVSMPAPFTAEAPLTFEMTLSLRR